MHSILPLMSADVLPAFFLFALGALFASFITVIAERAYTGQSWSSGRSRCNSCRETLEARDLVPIVSWLMGGGKCRRCGSRLPWAYVLGEAHALRGACQGADDQVWRSRMTRMIDVEKPDTAFRRRLIDSFNAGFVGRQSATTACNEAVAAQERAVAGRGRDLAQRLAGRP